MEPVKISVAGELKVDTATVADKRGSDGSVAVGISEKDISAGANAVPGQPVTSSIKGRSPQGDVDDVKVCEVLIRRKNSMGEKWGHPEKRNGKENGVDVIAVSDIDGTYLQMQVTRALTEEKHWKTLQALGEVDRKVAIDRLVNDIVTAVENKRSRSGKDIILVLNALYTPEHSFPEVVAAARDRHHSLNVGFKEVWVVGKTEALTHRLDYSADHD